MPSKVAVVIPVYKEELDPLEQISLAQVRKVLGKYPIMFAAPEGKNFSYFAQSDTVAYFPTQFFQSTRTYNRLMMSPQFYEMFKDCEYILIYQLDAFVFCDALEYFCSLGYDYIGAPWPRMYIENKKENFSRVGNGGFSLRAVKSHYNLLANHLDLVNQWLERQLPEDVFFSHCGKRDDCSFRVAPINIAYKFSAEFNLPRVIKKNGGKLPFGCHAWNEKDADFYTQLFLKLGYDLRPFKNLLFSSDKILNNWLVNLATQRLDRRINHGQPIMRYLPRDHFASIRVVRSPFAMIVFAWLILENPNLADEVYFYEENEQDILIDNLSLKKEPHLIIDFIDWVYDKNLISAATKKGITYDKRVVSFMREYLNYCEKIFHNLGK